ncbi:MAG: lamin tail domain-containing protein, partial [Bacteroidota bacterium]
MNKHLFKVFSLMMVMTLVLMALPTRKAQAVSTTIVISQVYGGGGNSGATYKNDFIEIYNLGSTAVNLTGWSVQYASTTGTSWTNKTNLSGTLQPGHYYLIQEAAGSGGNVSLPTPDLTGSINLSGTAGKVALVKSTVALSGSCPKGNTNVVDFVGFGTSTDCYEGTGPTATLSNTIAAIRNSDGSIDTDNNTDDFMVGIPYPRNSNPAPHGYGVGMPAILPAGGVSLLTVPVIPGYLPASTGLAVSCDLTAIGGSNAQAFFDDGNNGDFVAGDNVFSYRVTVPNNQGNGGLSFLCTASDAQLRSTTTTLQLTIASIIPIGSVNGIVSDSENPLTHRSPFAPVSGNNAGNTAVIVQGVIYETTLQAISGTTDSYKGFYIQNTAATADTDANSSDGLFVFMSTASTLSSADGPYIPQVGDEVVVSGRISEYYNMTEMQAPDLALVKPV